MPEKDPSNYTFLTYAWVMLLSCSGGIVSYINHMRSEIGLKKILLSLAREVFTSAFAGVITFYICEWGGVDHLLSAVFVAISGHMGTRAIYQIENFYKQKMPMIGEK